MPVRITGQDIANIDLALAFATSSTNLTATTSATGNVALTAGPFSVINEGNYYVQIYTPNLTKGTTNVDLELWQDGAPGTGTMVATITGHLAASVIPLMWIGQISLSAGSHTLRVAGFVDAGTGVFTAGAGSATGNNPRAFIRVYPS